MSRAMSRIGNAGSGTAADPRARSYRPPCRLAGERSPGRCPADDRGPRQPRQVRPRPGTTSPAAAPPTSATIDSPWSAPISRNATPSAASAAGSRSSSRPITARPSAPPSSASAGSNDAATGRPAIASVRTYGRFASDDVPRPRRRRRRQQVGLDERDRSPTACPTAFSRARSRASADTSAAAIATSSAGTPALRGARRPGDGDRAAARADVDDPRPAARRPRPRHVSRRHDLGQRRGRPVRSVSGRGISARASTANASPWNSLMPRM